MVSDLRRIEAGSGTSNREISDRDGVG